MSGAKRRSASVQQHFREKESKKGGRPAWNFFAPQQNSNKVSLNADSEGRSCYLLQLAKVEHSQPIASAKSAAAPLWGTSKGHSATAAAAGPTPSPVSAMVSPTRGEDAQVTSVKMSHAVRVPKADLLSAAERREWAERCKAQNVAASKNEAGLDRRRLADRSARTLDNPYRQYVPRQGAKPLMSDIMSGAFMDGPNRAAEKSCDFVALNRRQLRSASAVVGQCRRAGMFS
jgi:hypothetical protein